MLIRRAVLDGVQSGHVTLAFRRWQRPSVKTGGTLLTAAGELGIRSVTRITLEQISEEDAARAGYPSREDLLAELRRRTGGGVYRIEFGSLRPDPRIALRESAALTDEECRRLRDRLDRLDARATEGPWTRRTLEVIKAHPGVRAGDICLRLGQEKRPFKLNVRKLKGLGLTESLATGYRISPRGAVLMTWLGRAG